MSARSVPRSRIRIFRMNNCLANAYPRAKADKQINVHVPERRRCCARAFDSLQPDK